jgi:hypothetical protein
MCVQFEILTLQDPHRGQLVGGAPFCRHAADTCSGVEKTAAPPL